MPSDPSASIQLLSVNSIESLANYLSCLSDQPFWLSQVRERILKRCKEVEKTAIEQATDNAILDQLGKVLTLLPRQSFSSEVLPRGRWFTRYALFKLSLHLLSKTIKIFTNLYLGLLSWSRSTSHVPCFKSKGSSFMEPSFCSFRYCETA